MGDNSKILEDISALTQICRSNNDGPTLRIEENEIKNVESPTALMAKKIQELMRN